jgi:hypothetical protein
MQAGRHVNWAGRAKRCAESRVLSRNINTYQVQPGRPHSIPPRALKAASLSLSPAGAPLTCVPSPRRAVSTP